MILVMIAIIEERGKSNGTYKRFGIGKHGLFKNGSDIMFEILLGIAAVALYTNSETFRNSSDRSVAKDYEEGRISDKQYDNYQKYSDKIRNWSNNDSYDSYDD